MGVGGGGEAGGLPGGGEAAGGGGLGFRNVTALLTKPVKQHILQAWGAGWDSGILQSYVFSLL